MSIFTRHSGRSVEQALRAGIAEQGTAWLIDPHGKAGVRVLILAQEQAPVALYADDGERGAALLDGLLAQYTERGLGLPRVLAHERVPPEIVDWQQRVALLLAHVEGCA